MIATNPQIIVAKKAVPARDLQGLIAWLKANSTTATQGTAGYGSGSHLSGIYFQNITGARFQSPYQSIRAKPASVSREGTRGPMFGSAPFPRTISE